MGLRGITLVDNEISKLLFLNKFNTLKYGSQDQAYLGGNNLIKLSITMRIFPNFEWAMTKPSNKSFFFYQPCTVTV